MAQKKVINQQTVLPFVLGQLPVCSICKLTEERARCDISKSEKDKCGLTLCKKCAEANPQKICDEALTGCKKKVKQHRFKNNLRQKLKNDISSRFQTQSKFRTKLKLEKKYSEIDDDMSHILAALLGQSANVFTGFYRKQLDKLVDDLQNTKNTIQSQIERGNIPVFKGQKYTNDQDGGRTACGYISGDFSKGFNLIIKSFY